MKGIEKEIEIEEDRDGERERERGGGGGGGGEVPDRKADGQSDKGRDRLVDRESVCERLDC